MVCLHVCVRMCVMSAAALCTGGGFLVLLKDRSGSIYCGCSGRPSITDLLPLSLSIYVRMSELELLYCRWEVVGVWVSEWHDLVFPQWHVSQRASELVKKQEVLLFSASSVRSSGLLATNRIISLQL